MRNIFLAIFLSLTLSFSHAQKVGVVLSGGGAKGLYHIGVIKALEENNIPIDYIAGTSMGAIIAGMYSAGMSADDMIRIFNEDNVSGWASGKIDEKYKRYYNQEPPRPILFSTTINLQSLIESRRAEKLTDKTGGMFAGTPATVINASHLIPSVQLDVELMGYLSAASAGSKENFDNLFVPFRCIASDVVDKKQYVWKKGNLALAIRSSMAIPIVFSPIYVDSMVLYDGGVYNNFPWQELDSEFSPGFIIGSRCVSAGNSKISTLMGQIEMMVMQPTNYDIPKEKGLVIGRSVDVGMLDFSDPNIAINQGYEDALLMIDSIKTKVKREASHINVERRRLIYKANLPLLEFSSVSVEALNDVRSLKTSHGDTLYINTADTRIRSKLTKESYSMSGMKEVFYRTMNDRSMKSGFPTAIYDSLTGLYNLHVRMSSVPTFRIRAGLNISSTSINQAYLGVVYNDNRRNNGIYSVDGYLGSFYNAAELYTRHNFYNHKLPFYISTALTYNYIDYARANNQKITYNSQFKEGEFNSNDLYFSSSIGIRVRKDSRAEARLAIGENNVRFSDKYFNDEQRSVERARVRYITGRVAIESNTLNYPTFATRGKTTILSASVTRSWEKILSSKMNTVDTELSYKNKDHWFGVRYYKEEYYTMTKFFSFGFNLDAIWTSLPSLGDEYVYRSFAQRYTPTEFSKTLFLPEFQHKSYIAAGVMPIFEVNDKLYLKGSFNVLKPDILHYKDLVKKFKYVASAAAVFQSPIGPISISYNRFSVSSAKKDYLIFNFGYMIFNKRGVIY